jgi:hypothetical protein
MEVRNADNGSGATVQQHHGSVGAPGRLRTRVPRNSLVVHYCFRFADLRGNYDLAGGRFHCHGKLWLEASS